MSEVAAEPEERKPTPEELEKLRSQRRRDNFEYDIDLEDEDSHASAAQLALLEKRNKKLMDQLEELEDKVFDSEELRTSVQRKLSLIEEEVVDYKSLLSQRDSQNSELRKQAEITSKRVKELISTRTQLESERRQLEHKIVLLQTEYEQNERAQSMLDKADDEIDHLRTRIEALISQKAQSSKLLSELEKKKAQLEKRVQEKSVRGREENERTVQDFEKIIDSERKRGQESIDYVRRTLNAKIRFLELQLEEARETEANYKKDRRKLDYDLKAALRQIEEEHAKSTRASRRIETLERSIVSTQEQINRLLLETDACETENYSLSRQVDALTAQYDAAIYINERLNAEVPKESIMLIEDKAENEKSAAPVKDDEKPEDKLEAPQLGETK